MAVQKKKTTKDTPDKVEKDFISCPDIAADAINSLLYKGRRIVSSEALMPAPTETFYQGTDGLRNQYEDIAQYEMAGGKIKIMYLLANQSKPDSKMLFREASYIGGAYREQRTRKITDAYPVIPIVLNWGIKKWSKKRRLKQLFRRKKFSEEEWAYIGDQELLVFDMRHLSKEIRERFQSDLRIVVDYLAEGEQALMSNHRITHKQELVKMLGVLSGETDLEEIERKLQVNDNRKGDENMAGVFTEALERSKALGIAIANVSCIENFISNQRISLEKACKDAGISVQDYHNAKKLISEQKI